MTNVMPQAVGNELAELTIVDWAKSFIEPDSTLLLVDHGERPANVHGADATGQALVSNGALGADVLRLPAGAGFSPHTHPGHHILIVVGGEGTITYDGRIHHTRAGQVYLVEGEVPHAVGAITDHVILAVGSPHKAIDAEDRMAPVPYEEVIAPDGDLTCLICDVSAFAPHRLHTSGCPHCPCRDCVTGSAR
ncbi:cupin domain-containing protein [Streptomyces sp. RB6PN25]|uniref:Cupin domain-containing protein n=1 Tax=Streptomyces humicola TaxID=2953240 RepID=A0ABT1PPL3_9ACTN|nr:cupin domain-containing protein [Streptomyces humicola]MCQ4079622.1 cupin domain-containing protein [Streptomyces humicola]